VENGELRSVKWAKGEEAPADEEGWKNAGDLDGGYFAADSVYRTMYTLKAASGYAFSADYTAIGGRVERLGSGTAEAGANGDTLTVTVTWPPTAPADVIDQSTISIGLIPPVAGKTIADRTNTVSDGADGTGTPAVTWAKGESAPAALAGTWYAHDNTENLESTGKFAEHTVYHTKIVFTSASGESGNKFDSIPGAYESGGDYALAIAGAASFTALVSGEAYGNTLTVIVTWPATGEIIPPVYLYLDDTPQTKITFVEEGEADFAAAIAWLKASATNAAYTIELNDDTAIAPGTLLDATTMQSGADGIRITLKGAGIERKISLTAAGALITVGKASGTFAVTLVLGDKITLQGIGGVGGTEVYPYQNSSALVNVLAGGKLIVQSGARIIGHKRSSGNGGGVFVSYGAFEMSGGEISGNYAKCGSGVYVARAPEPVVMSGGEIKGNLGLTSAEGIGIYIKTSTFNMSGGTISGNHSSVSVNSSLAGGIYFENALDNGHFMTLSGGIITGNSSLGDGGGIYIIGRGAPEGHVSASLTGVEISNNSAGRDGGGVFIKNDYTSTVTVGAGTVIKGNQAAGNGGGVFIGGDKVTFTKTGGIIYGDSNNTHTANENENTVTTAAKRGHAVYQSDSYFRDADALSTDDITASSTDHAGLSSSGVGPF
jgi:hypothetical protein